MVRGGLLTRHATFYGFQHIVADILFGLGALVSDTGSFRKSDGARQTDATMRGGLATRHAAFDGFQHFVASIVAEFMYAFSPDTEKRRGFVRGAPVSPLSRLYRGHPLLHPMARSLHPNL